jgi:hypothetical protein
VKAAGFTRSGPAGLGARDVLGPDDPVELAALGLRRGQRHVEHRTEHDHAHQGERQRQAQDRPEQAAEDQRYEAGDRAAHRRGPAEPAGAQFGRVELRDVGVHHRDHHEGEEPEDRDHHDGRRRRAQDQGEDQQGQGGERGRDADDPLPADDLDQHHGGDDAEDADRVHHGRGAERGDLAHALRPQDGRHPGQGGVVDDHHGDEQRPGHAGDLRVERPDQPELVDGGGQALLPRRGGLRHHGRDLVGLGRGAGPRHHVVDDGPGLGLAPGAGEVDRRFRHAAADPEQQDRGQHHQREHPAPVAGDRHEERGGDAGERGADRPPAVHRGEHPPALLARRELADDRVVHRDAAAQADAGQEAEHQEDLPARRQRAQHGEQREDHQGDREGLLAAHPVRDGAPGDRTDRHADQVGRRDEAALAGAEPELGAEQWGEEAVQGDVPGVEHVPETADDEDPALHPPLPREVLDDLVACTHDLLRFSTQRANG